MIGDAEELTDEDRDLFLRCRGLEPGISAEKAAEIRAQWPDEHIAMAIALGQF